jgi:hypothetical protein
MRTRTVVIAVAVAGMLAACGSDGGSGFGDDGLGDGTGSSSGSGSGGSSSGGKSSSSSGTSSGGGGSSSGTSSSGGGSSSSGSGSSGGGSSSGTSSGGGDGGLVDDGGDYNTPVVCTSGTTWTGGDSANPLMHPGVACDTCHKLLGSATKFPFDMAGTVYPTAHEPDDCNGVQGAQVIITDASGTDHTLQVNAAGNFYNLNYVGLGAISTPYTARVVANGKTRVMVGPQTSGDCNSCHSEQGTQAAPGRIMMP